MKKTLLLTAAIGLVLFVQSQSYDNAKNMAILSQFKKAKEQFDKDAMNAKYMAKPEAYILKTLIYGGLAMDKEFKETPGGDKLIADADVSFTKYREMDPSVALISDAVYQNGPINIYSYEFSSGYADYNNNKWKEAYPKFKKVVEYGDFMISKKLISIQVDTNALVLAGITAQNAGLDEEAVIYYRRLADLHITGAEYENIYRYLVKYYYSKDDMVSFEKYRQLGKTLYPNADYFNFDKVDFAIGLETDFTKKMALLDKIVSADASNEKAYEAMGELIYDTLNSTKEGAIQPANVAELEPKMVNAFTKVAALNPANEVPYIFIGNHYFNKSGKIKNHSDPQYISSQEGARDAFEKAAAIYAKKEKLTGREKQQYRQVAGILGDIYTDKKTRAKGNAADLAKFTAAEKKWNDLYDSLK